MRESEAAIALAAFHKVADRWGLTDRDRAALLAADVAEQRLRISYMLGIFAGLHAVLGESDPVDDWVRRPNLDFDGNAPLKIMLDGKDGLARVRAYVDQWAD